MNTHSSPALENIERLLGSAHVRIDPKTLGEETENTLGVTRYIMGIVYPGSTEEVLEIVKIANSCRTPLYPVSAGRNIGYGEKAPVMEGQLIVDLGRMNTIRSFDNIHGYIVLEPGVTQKQLFEYLKKNKSRFWMDATGAGIESSIIGNTLEGGFGHTPKGDRRATVSDFEVVLGNGTLLQTGTFPGLGPDLSGLFIQSNFGIITAAKMELMPVPERFVSFVATVQEDAGLEPLVDTLRTLRQRDTLTSLVHIGNATRYMMTASQCPEEYAQTLISCETARQIMSSPLLKVGYWSCVGGIYGTSREVKTKKKEIRSAFSRSGKVTIFHDAKIDFIERLSGSRFLRKSALGSAVKKSIESYRHVHGLMKGMPSDEPLKNIRWRVDAYDRMGLIWYSPTVAASGTEVRKAVTIAERLYKEFHFEMPVTITMLTPHQVVCVLSISFDKFNDEEKNRAHRLYNELKSTFSKAGIGQYRHGIIGQDAIKYAQIGKYESLRQLKSVFDPNTIIAPGRYGL